MRIWLTAGCQEAAPPRRAAPLAGGGPPPSTLPWRAAALARRWLAPARPQVVVPTRDAAPSAAAPAPWLQMRWPRRLAWPTCTAACAAACFLTRRPRRLCCAHGPCCARSCAAPGRERRSGGRAGGAHRASPPPPPPPTPPAASEPPPAGGLASPRKPCPHHSPAAAGWASGNCWALLPPPAPRPPRRRGVALAKAGDLGGALPCYDQALQLDAGNADALVARGAALANRRQWQRAAGEGAGATGWHVPAWNPSMCSLSEACLGCRHWGPQCMRPRCKLPRVIRGKTGIAAYCACGALRAAHWGWRCLGSVARIGCWAARSGSACPSHLAGTLFGPWPC